MDEGCRPHSEDLLHSFAARFQSTGVPEIDKHMSTASAGGSTMPRISLGDEAMIRCRVLSRQAPGAPKKWQEAQ
jgi:hypothetical protein